MQIKTIPTSTVVHGIAKKNNKFLLIKEKSDRWHIPTGKVKKGELPSEAIIREVKEESGANCTPLGIFKLYNGFLQITNESGKMEQINRTHYFFEIEIKSDIINEPNEHTNGAGWFKMVEIKNLPLLTPKLFPHLEDFDKCKMNKSVLPMEFVLDKI